jgi:large subunit ribosomal protein L17
MRHGIAGRKLNRTSSHRKALFCNLATNLLEHEQIKTTLPKAKDLRKVVEPLITYAKKGDLASRRQAARIVKDPAILKKLFDEIGPRFKERPGGYTRVMKFGFRQGDAAPMAIIALTDMAEEKPAKAEKPKVEAKDAVVEAKAETPAKAAAPKKEASEKKTPAKKAPAKKAAPKKDAAEKAE